MCIGAQHDETNNRSEHMLNVKEAALAVGVSVSYLNQKRCYGGGPRYAKLGRCVRYDRADLDVWVDERKMEVVGEVRK